MPIIHKEILDAVVLVECPETGTTGTGFMINTRSGEQFVVTAAHVIEEQWKKGSEELLKVWASTSHGPPHAIHTKNQEWTLHPERNLGSRENGCDIAVYQSRSAALAAAVRCGARLRSLPVDIQAGRTEMDARETWEGSPILTFGYPGFLRSSPTAWLRECLYGHRPYARAGVISQVQPMLEGLTRSFTVDCPSYEGQSGSPIISAPTALRSRSAEGNAAEPRLVGVLVATRKAPVLQIENNRIPIRQVEQNAGIGICAPMDEVWKTCDASMD